MIGFVVLSILAAAMAASTTCARAGVIWLHGLGDSGAGWTFLQDELSSLAHITWKFPNAPNLPVFLAGGQRMPAWFDLKDIPVAPNSVGAEDLNGISASVDTVKKLVNDFIAEGIPAERIVIGGFSQGACTAVLAGLQSDVPIAGIVAFSGWLPHEKYLTGLPAARRPILIAHGTADDKVSYPLGKALAERLSSFGHTVNFKTYHGMGHTASMEEIKDLREWFSHVLP
ncbi:acyl-protein thioesterase 1-like isoform X3 [Achlya hypogyna]|uniref:Acyl-protein thioesterase 1-like isoform X3 n=1 Tax=Achlya hypogyna TaxID=1202772 RepID=A0A0A7CM12_ACHHY|nr:secreted protein [Achlya hypogyna]OQS00627.1 acyl-protein thioesterase 1-like isoform X3 [Achlya hypogyna]